MKTIAITGGIGTGKSVVSRVLAVMGYPVYDCDAQAKRLMTSDAALVASIKELLGDEAYNSDGSYNVRYVSGRIFANPELVAAMNSLVHPAVLSDIERWSQSCPGELCFVETALYRESNMESVTDDVWTVTAPTDVRLARVMRRSNLTEAETRARIARQSNDQIDTPHIIVNDSQTAILPQVLSLLNHL